MSRTKIRDLAVIAVVVAAGMVWYGFAVSVAWQTRRADSDIGRNWVVGRYLLAGRNPYALSEQLLALQFGAGNPESVHISAIDQNVPQGWESEMEPGLGPPETTYPPPAAGFFALLLGWMPSADAVLVAWQAVNVLALLALAFLLSRWYAAPQWLPGPAWVWFLALALLQLPAYYTVVSAQVGLVVLVCLLVGCRRESGNLVAGLALGTALIKPSIALPFMALPVAQHRWRPLAIAALFQGALFAGVAWAAQEDPLTLLRRWLNVTGYFVPVTPYTLHEVINRLGWQAAGLIPLAAALALIGGFTLLLRRASGGRLLGFVSVASCLWMYHLPYDFVCLLPGLVVLLGWEKPSHGRQPSWALRWLAVGAVVVVLNLALSDAVVTEEWPASRLLRWAGRLAVVGVLVASSCAVVRARRAALG